ncbi:hypothetical protein K3M67_04670 [Sphingobium sp. V4]|uniref:hypothetical protein n=1 Tax=Sphingobium sp. V4 TaxID=3038927 RepID=UPI00255833BB|nr:hypothetical protein [Sphingobium sp. V4]WIW89272.1 hypothetical protein K3M67_04670 [Sphingobium sp. V4]
MMALLNKPSLMQRECDEWNKRYPIGQAVVVRLDSGEDLHTKTSTEAQLLSGHSAVIWLDGISGCYLLGRVKPVTEEPA